MNGNFPWLNCEGASTFIWLIKRLFIQTTSSSNKKKTKLPLISEQNRSNHGKEQLKMIQMGENNAVRSSWAFHMYEDNQCFKQLSPLVYFLYKQETYEELATSVMPWLFPYFCVMSSLGNESPAFWNVLFSFSCPCSCVFDASALYGSVVALL